jgi:hypothetical protein
MVSSLPRGFGVIWGTLLIGIFVLMQPQFLLYRLPFFHENLVGLSDWLIFLFPILFIPIWSHCFGWIFVRGGNWLNHFPVLGKKVF